jgi:hypothetical protein
VSGRRMAKQRRRTGGKWKKRSQRKKTKKRWTWTRTWTKMMKNPYHLPVH